MVEARLHEEFVRVADGTSLFVRRWTTAGEVGRPVVIFVHGFLEHAGRYERFLQKLSEAGFEVVAVDLRGHGRSQGPRAWFRSVDELLADLTQVFGWVKQTRPTERLALVGHSLGGLLVGLWAARNPSLCQMAVLVAPAITIGALPGWVRQLAPLVAFLFPWARIIRMGAKALSRDPQVVDDFLRDPLVYHGRIPMCSGHAILQAAAKFRRQLHEVTVPFLVLHGTADRICTARGSRELYEKAASRDKTLRLYPGLFHDLLHEPEAELVEQDIIHWLSQRATIV